MGLTIQRTQLDGLVTFLAVAEARGFRSAARSLGVTPSAVSQAIQALEQRVGAPLFTRTTRSVGLTQAGERLLAHARPAVEMLSAGLDAASDLGSEIQGKLRITLPQAVLPLITNVLLPEFLERHPDLQLELIGDDELVDIVAEGFDAGIRLGNLVEADMVGVWLTPPERFAVVGTPAFFRTHGLPRHPRDLASFRCITFQRSSRSLRPWYFTINGKRTAVHVRGPLITNDLANCVRAALRGVGLFCVVRSLVKNHIEEGRLQTVLDKYAYESPGLTLYYPSRNQSLPKLRAFVRFATERMRRGFPAEDFQR